MRHFVLDTETTGVRPGVDRVVELFAGLRNGEKWEKTFYKRLDPGVPIPEGASKVNGIFDEDVKGCPAFGEVAVELGEFLLSEDLPVYIHNVRFDKPMLEGEYKRAGHKMPEPAAWICTLEMSRACFPGAENHLGAVAERLGIAVEGRAHSAGTDCDTLARLLPALIQRYTHKMLRTSTELARKAEVGPIQIGGTAELLAAAGEAVGTFNLRVPQAQAYAGEFACEDDEDEKNGHEAIGRTKKIAKEADDKRKELTGALDKSKREIDALFNAGVRDPLAAVQKVIEDKIRPYALGKIQAQRAAQIAAAEALAKAQAAIAEAEVVGAAPGQTTALFEAVHEAAAQVYEAQAPQSPVKAATATAGYETIYTAHILAPAAVPREYWEPSLALVQRAVDNGARQIAGVEIREELKIKNRRR